MSAVVLLLLDAFRYDYLKPDVTPFLCACASKGRYIERVVPGFGYCERAEIFTGKTPLETGYLTAIGFDPERSPFKGMETYLRALALAEACLPVNLARRALRKTVRPYFLAQPHGLDCYHIPYRFLSYLALTEDYYDLWDPRTFETPSIFDHLRAKERSFFYDSFTALNFRQPMTDEDRLRTALQAADQGHSLYLIYISAPDYYGHYHGSEAPETARALGAMDDSLRSFVEQFERTRPGSKYVFLGDHGMVRVDTQVDLARTLVSVAKSLGLRPCRDYLYFLDSTLCRVWFLNPKARERLAPALRGHSVFQENGVFLDVDQPGEISIPLDDRRYGDLLWLANGGVLVSPDFFHHGKKKVYGMHGYSPLLPESQGMCIVYGDAQRPARTAELPLTGIYDILREGIV